MKIVTQVSPFGLGYSVYDADEYDGAEDAGPQLVGNGDTAAEALEDFHEQRLEREAERDCKRAISQGKVWDSFLCRLFGLRR